MSGLHSALQDYLTLRRAMGFTMQRHATLVGQFVDFLAAAIPTDHGPPSRAQTL